jgi:DNA-binding NtrC family response regulator
MPARILLYGIDAALLRTRAGVLESAGFQVAVAIRLLEIEQALLSEPSDLLILCYTLTPEECRQALASALECNVGIQTVLLVQAGFVSSPQRHYDAVFDAFQGPGELVATVSRILTRNQPEKSHRLPASATQKPVTDRGPSGSIRQKPSKPNR